MHPLTARLSSSEDCGENAAVGVWVRSRYVGAECTRAGILVCQQLNIITPIYIYIYYDRDGRGINLRLKKIE